MASEVCIGQASPHVPETGASNLIESEDRWWVGGISGVSFVPEVERTREDPRPQDEWLFWCTGGSDTRCFPERAPSRQPLSSEMTPREVGPAGDLDFGPRGAAASVAYGAGDFLQPQAGVRSRIRRPPK